MTVNADDVIEEFGPGVARIAASYERNCALREELAQEMLLAIVQALPRLRDPTKLKAFVFRIAHNRAMRHIARRMREPVSAAKADDLAGDTPTQEQFLIDNQRSTALLHAVRSLTLPYRQVITLVLEGLSYQEIADALGISVVNVGVRANRARQQLRELLQHDG